MPFLPDKTKTAQKFVNNYLILRENYPVLIQILDDASIKFQHWLKTSDKPKGFPVPCLGYRDCPICLRNRSLGENPKDHPDYLPVSKRYSVNVVDITPCKRVGDNVYIAVLDENGRTVFPSHGANGELLDDVAVTPVNEVKILERGPDLFEKKLRPLSTGRVTDLEDRPLEITQFPIELTLVGTGRNNANVDVVTKVGHRYTVNPTDYQNKLHDLSAGFRFSAEEIESMLSGTTHTDILAARKAMAEMAKPSVYAGQGNEGLGSDIEY